MLTVYELALLADAIYDAPPKSKGSWGLRKTIVSTAGTGLQAAAYSSAGQTVIAFKGTSSGKDVYNDLKLGVGMNTDYFSAACEFASTFGATDNVTLCGHSLGGAIAQIVANRKGFKFITFNAPGVAVVASREILHASPAMTALRIGGALASAVVHPMQAMQDAKAMFNRVRGVNMRLSFDVVSAVGLHYGKTITINGSSHNPGREHRMTTFLKVLETSPYKNQSILSLI